MSFFLTRLGEKPGEMQLLNKFENLIKRLSLICTHLRVIAQKSEVDFTNLSRSIKEGHRIGEAFRSFKYEIEKLLELLLSLLHFVRDREETIRIIKAELERLQKEFGAKVFINDFTLRRHFEDMQQILQRENGDLELVKDLHKRLINIQLGKLVELAKLIRAKEPIFPPEHANIRDEFLYYLRKLIGAFHDLSKLVLRVERLEAEEEANFSYLYTLLGDPRVTEVHQTEVQKTIYRLEREF